MMYIDTNHSIKTLIISSPPVKHPSCMLVRPLVENAMVLYYQLTNTGMFTYHFDRYIAIYGGGGGISPSLKIE